MGLHQCVGQPIARLEMEIVLQQMLEHVDTISWQENHNRSCTTYFAASNRCQ
ncbi:cytochrome P450 [Pseudoglutamicibacter albus]|uniref:cytochrome P450 n=1 Tax=Pseudoglutamicibacter albus TaxID=98671 RepID=UPI00361EECB3